MSTTETNEKGKRYMIANIISLIVIIILITGNIIQAYREKNETTDVTELRKEIIELKLKLHVEQSRSEDAMVANRAILMLAEMAYESDTTAFTPYQKKVFHSMLTNEIAVQDMKTILTWYDKLSPVEKHLVRPDHPKEAAIK